MRRGGRERQLSLLCHYNSGINHHIIAFHKTRENYVYEYNLKVSFTGRRIKRFSVINNYVKNEKIDLIHTWGNSETIYALPIAKLNSIPLLNGSIRHGIRNNTLSQKFRTVVLQHSYYILGNSYAGFYANKIKIKKKKHFVLYNGIEEKFFTGFCTERRSIINKEKNLDNKSIVFVSIANFVPYKDYYTPILALSQLKDEGLSFHYFIIGKGPMLNEISNLISEKNLTDNISIFSDNPDIPYLLSVSDIMIHSSLGEGCSNAILEGSAAGLPVIASNTGGTKEIINTYCSLFEYKNINDLKEKILKTKNLLITTPDLRSKIMSITRERFSVKSFVNNYKEIINKILK